jgi:hypothetical protein
MTTGSTPAAYPFAARAEIAVGSTIGNTTPDDAPLFRGPPRSQTVPLTVAR